MCMLGKGHERYHSILMQGKNNSYALVENIGTVEFQIRIESIENELKIFNQAQCSSCDKIISR